VCGSDVSVCGPDAPGGSLQEEGRLSPPMERPDAREPRERGAALVEFAFVLPVLLLLVLGIIDFGRAYGAKQELTHASREAVRVYAVTQNHDEATAACETATQLDVNCGAAIPNVPCTPGAPVQVSLSYDFDFIALPFASIDIGSEAVMRCGG
jgi:hypothetical protein